MQRDSSVRMADRIILEERVRRGVSAARCRVSLIL
jgi:hypothetical protein